MPLAVGPGIGIPFDDQLGAFFAPPQTDSNLLAENGNFLLAENGDFLLAES